MAGAAVTGGAAAVGGRLPAADVTAEELAPAPGQLRRMVGLFRESRSAWVATHILIGFALVCVLLPLALPWSATEIDRAVPGATAPSMSHPLGTDAMGRDELARVLYAGRVSLTIGLMVALISSTIGTLVGLVAGYFGGRTESVVMAGVDVLLTIPPLPLLIGLSALVASPHSSIGALFRGMPEQWRIIFIMSILGWMGISRIVRSTVISLKNQEFVEAAQAFGASHGRIMFIHILPNSVSSIVIFTTFAVSGAIMGESGLSFLGLGVNPPTPTWGNMIAEASTMFYLVRFWWLAWFPALAILITILCVNFIGEGLRDSFNPRR